MSIGIGGAGSKLSSLMDEGKSTIYDVSGVDLDKVVATNKIRAVVHSSKNQLKGARKDPKIGREAFQSVKNNLTDSVRGNLVFCSTGGGTGNGLCSEVLEHLSQETSVPLEDKTKFIFLLPSSDLESSDFIDNSINFLQGPVSSAIDAGNTGNIFLFSNRLKFQNRIPEKAFNQMLKESLDQFYSIPTKGELLDQLDGRIDSEDFKMYNAKPYFNHFCQFKVDLESPFGPQLKANYNPLLLAPEGTIEALFLLELPDPEKTQLFYNIIDAFLEEKVSPAYSVLHNPKIKKPLITVSLLYSRKPLELVESFSDVSIGHKRERVQKSLEQFVTLSKLEVDLTSEAKNSLNGNSGADEILSVLKRIGKL